jgi:hypothetical protein
MEGRLYKMRKLKLKKRNTLTSRMEWHFDEAPEQESTERHITEKETNKNRVLAPHMDYYFDEITEKESIRCPVTGGKATVEVVRKASMDDMPFVDVAYCSIFGCAPTCDKQCLRRINHMKHFQK